MGRSHRKLRAKMLERDMDLTRLGWVVGLGRTASSARLNGHEPWRLDEVYKLCSVLNIPLAEIPDYFPPQKEVQRIGS